MQTNDTPVNVWFDFVRAVNAGDATKLREILTPNVDPSVYQQAYHYLRFAVEKGYVDVVKAVVDAAESAESDVGNQLEALGPKGLLLDCIRFRQPMIFKYLYNKGVRVNFENQYFNMLEERQFEILDFLEEKGEVTMEKLKTFWHEMYFDYRVGYEAYVAYKEAGKS
jgi:hypothetical protein